MDSIRRMMFSMRPYRQNFFNIAMSAVVFYVGINAYDSKIKREQFAWQLNKSEETLKQVSDILRENKTVDSEVHAQLSQIVDVALGRVEEFKIEHTKIYDDPDAEKKEAPRMI